MSAVVIAVVFASTPAGAATTTVNVTFNLASASYLSTASCLPASLSLGSILPGSTGITTSDCTLTFGSSNDTSKLRMWQMDGSGQAMFSWTTGVPDAGFSAGGVKRVTPPGGGSGAIASMVAGGGTSVATDGDLLKGGSKGGNFAVGRWNLDGTIDAGWGTAGYATTDAGSIVAGGTANRPADVLALRSGKVAQSGVVTRAADEHVAVVRLTSTGGIDGTFGGGDGVADFALPSLRTPQRTSLLELPDGSLLVTGGAVGTPDDEAFVAKLTPVGALDLSFGGGDGIFELFNPGAVIDMASAATVDDGKIVIVGGMDDQPFVARISEAGALDLTYGGGDGWERNAAAGLDNARNGGFVDAAGNTYVLGDAGCNNIRIARFTPAGLADTAWFANGMRPMSTLATTFQCGDAGDTVELGDGRFCTGGDTGSGAVEGYWVGCFLASGAWDTSFNTTGYVKVTATNVESNGGGFAMANGRAYLGGGASDWTLVAIGSDAQTIPDYVNPTTNFASSSGAFGVCLRDVTNATATWNVAPGNACTGDGNWWNGVPAYAAAAPAQVATAAATVTNAQAKLRFGARPGGTANGAFVAPIFVEVIAP